MKPRFIIIALLLIGCQAALSQMATSHSASTAVNKTSAAAAITPAFTASNKPVARVNGAVISDRDLVREMYSIFPYGRQHNGFPKAMEADIRKGALDMLIFEELVYQETVRRKMTIPAAVLDKGEAELVTSMGKQQFSAFLQQEFGGSRPALRQAIRRSMLVDRFLKAEVQRKSITTVAEARASYESNPKRFEIPETVEFQTISVLPANNSPAAVKAAQTRAADVLARAKATKSYEEFGLLAEKISEDDFRVTMGDHHAVPFSKLPPVMLSALQTMKRGDVSDVLQLDNADFVFRVNARHAAGKRTFAQVRNEIRFNMQKAKAEQLRSRLNQSLKKTAKIEVLS